MKRKKWVKRTAIMGEKTNIYSILVGKLEGKKKHSEHLEMYGKITLTWCGLNVVTLAQNSDQWQNVLKW